jgi:hypothetical protein
VAGQVLGAVTGKSGRIGPSRVRKTLAAATAGGSSTTFRQPIRLETVRKPRRQLELTSTRDPEKTEKC